MFTKSATRDDARSSRRRAATAHNTESVSFTTAATRTVERKLLTTDVSKVDARRKECFPAYRRRVLVADIVSASLASALATKVGPLPQLHAEYAAVSIAMVAMWPILILLVHGYDKRYLGVTVEEYRAVGTATVMLLGVVGVAAVTFNVLVSRAYVIVLICALFTLSLSARRLSRAWLKRQRTQGKLMQRTLIVGHLRAAEDLIANLRRCPDQGLLPVGICDAVDQHQEPTEGLSAKNATWSGADDVLLALQRCDADVVIALTSAGEFSGTSLRRLAWLLEERDVELLVSTGVLDVAGPRLTIRPSEHFSLLHIERPAATKAHVFYKTVLDRAMALLLIVIFAPVLLTVSLAVKLTSPGPVLFRQNRIGAGGQPFRIFKFRTMFDGADQHLTSLRHLSEGNAVQFKLRKDPRVTPVGAALRKYSLDELPQLFNVLLGHMSLVGPRPQSQQEVDQYEPDALRRLRVRPGMTGLWQISGRSDLSWEESLRLDLRYVDNWSPVVDLQILTRTLRAVVKGSGAY